MSPSTEAMTTAARTVMGRSWNKGASTSAVASTNAAVTSDETCVRAPDASAVADWDRLASTMKPPNRPEERFAPPRATSSWSLSISW